MHCNALVDAQGRTVLLHGVNARVNGVFDVSFDDGRLPNETIPDFGADDAARIRALGFNALRLPIQWSAIEPTDANGGTYEDAYLDTVAGVVATCGNAGVLVLLDFHQDAYSKEIGEDGAPLWAIQPPPAQLLGGPMGGALPDGGSSPDLGARRNSAQVAGAFATFFDSDAGQPLRDRFTKMASHVAARFASDPDVVGFELYNEPITSDANAQSLYAEMIPAVRAAAPQKLIFFEPSALRNELDEAPLGDGNVGAGTVYAPHVYTEAFVSNGEPITREELEPSNLRARDEADSWGAPLVVTEYGFGPSDPQFANYVEWEQEAQDEARASSFFWLWKEESQGSWGFYDFGDAGAPTERGAVVQAMARIRPEAISGRIASVAYDPTAKQLTVHFIGAYAITAPNIVSVSGGLLGAAKTTAGLWSATCDGVTLPTDGSDPMSLECDGDGDHALVVTLAPQ